MRFLAAVATFLWAAASLASAQIAVSAQTSRSTFLLYERVDLQVTITNMGENDLVLDNDEGRPWLSFLVSHQNRLPVRHERQATFRPLTLKVGEAKTLDINITPLFSFRDEGDYTAEAVVDLPGEGQMISDPVPFTVLHGHTVWSMTRPMNGTEYVYSLLRFNPKPMETKLYLRVEDPSDNIVLANYALGELAAYIDPDVFFDPQGNLHILQPIAEGSYLYSRADPSGKLEHQGIFRTFQSVPPRLKKLADGNVIVLGGMEDNPNQPRETLSGGQNVAQTPPPAPESSAAAPEIGAGPMPTAPSDTIPVAHPASASPSASPSASAPQTGP